MENNIFYVYMYLDPRKSGWFEYDNIKTIFEPIYVGKGKGTRDTFHIRGRNCRSLSYKTKFNSKINKILSLGIKPVIIRYQENLTEKDAHQLEVDLIKRIGRKDLNLGPLCNLTDGGEGETGKIITKKARTHSGVFKKGTIPWNKGKKGLVKMSEEANKLRTSKLIGKKRNKEQKLNISRSLGGTSLLQYDLDGNFIKEWETEIECSKHGFNDINRTIRLKRNICKGYLWYKKDSNEIPQKVNKYIPHKKSKYYKAWLQQSL